MKGFWWHLHVGSSIINRKKREPTWGSSVILACSQPSHLWWRRLGNEMSVVNMKRFLRIRCHSLRNQFHKDNLRHLPRFPDFLLTFWILLFINEFHTRRIHEEDVNIRNHMAIEKKTTNLIKILELAIWSYSYYEDISWLEEHIQEMPKSLILSSSCCSLLIIKTWPGKRNPSSIKRPSPGIRTRQLLGRISCMIRMIQN